MEVKKKKTQRAVAKMSVTLTLVDAASGEPVSAKAGASVKVTGFDFSGKRVPLTAVLKEERGKPGVFSFSGSMVTQYYAQIRAPGYADQDVVFTNAEEPKSYTYQLKPLAAKKKP